MLGILYISYDGILEPLGQSQVLSYLERLSIENRIYHNINVSFYGIEGESLMLLLDEAGIQVSTGSACSSKKLEESKVLKAINVDELYIHGSLRITLGNNMDHKKADYLIENIKTSVEKLREMSPFKLEDEEWN